MTTDEEIQPTYVNFLERTLDVEENPRTDFMPVEGYQSQSLVSITVAAQKLKSVTLPISLEFLEFKKRTFKTSLDGITVDEALAIQLYTMGEKSNNLSFYESLNYALREKDMTIIKSFLPFLKLFITALSKLEPVKQTLCRGIKADLSEKYPVGKTFVWSEFSSCATSGQVLSPEYFLDATGARTFFQIHSSSGRNIRQYSSLPTEDEIILLPGTKFTVISQTSPSIDLHLIEIQEVAPSILLPQSSTSISNERSLDPINIQMMNMNNDLINLSNNIGEQRNKIEGKFSSMQLNDDQIPLIANELKTNTSWKVLKLNNNKISNPGMVELSPALVLNSTLEILVLNNNYVNDYGIKRLAQALNQNFTLVNLTLYQNGINNAGAKSLAELLRTNTTLTSLSLDDNTIGDHGMIALCETLAQYNRTLKKLSMNNNIVSDGSLEAMLGFYTMNNVVDDFKYNGNKFSKQALNILQAANKKNEELFKPLVYINQVAVVYLELKSIPEKQLSHDASYLFTNFRRLLSPTMLENFTKIPMNSTTYLILCCEDDATIRLISSFCSKKKILLFVLQTTKKNIDKNANIFNCEESMMFRLATRIANQYRALGDHAVRIKEKEKGQIYFQQSISMQQKLVNYLKKRRINSLLNQHNTCGGSILVPDIPTSKSVISVVEN